MTSRGHERGMGELGPDARAQGEPGQGARGQDELGLGKPGHCGQHRFHPVNSTISLSLPKL